MMLISLTSIYLHNLNSHQTRTLEDSMFGLILCHILKIEKGIFPLSYNAAFVSTNFAELHTKCRSGQFHVLRYKFPASKTTTDRYGNKTSPLMLTISTTLASINASHNQLLHIVSPPVLTSFVNLLLLFLLILDYQSPTEGFFFFSYRVFTYLGK